MKKFLGNILIVFLVTMSVVSLSGCGGGAKSLEGTWVLVSDNDREVEFTKDKMRFNFFVYAYEVEGNTIHFQQTHPTKNGWRGKMTYSFDGDILELDLGDMDGYFFGHSGTVRLERPKSLVD